MKNYTVQFEVEGQRFYLNIEAKLVLKIADEQIIADGVKISLPGKLIEIKS
jgi:hypothetical protein